MSAKIFWTHRSSQSGRLPPTHSIGFKIIFMLCKSLEWKNLGPDHTNALLKVSVFVSTKTEQNILTTQAFHLSTLIRFHWRPLEKAYFLIRFVYRPQPERLKTLMELWLFLRHRLQTHPFSTIHTRNGAFSKRCVFSRVLFWNRFRKPPFSLPFSVVLVWGRKCIKMYEF